MPSIPTCKRCRIDCPRRIDRLTLQKDDERIGTVKADLCRDCSRALEAWLDPPESVRAGWADRKLGRQA